MSEFNASMNGILGGLSFVQDNVREGVDRRQKAGLGALMADYASGGAPDYQGIAANGGNPLAVRQDADGQKQGRLKELGQFAGYLASIKDPVARNRTYVQLRPKLDAIGQEFQLGPLPDMLDDSHMDELQSLYTQFGGGSEQGQLPAEMQMMEYYKRNPDAYKMQTDLRQASANPFGFQVITGPDGVSRLVQTNRREGGAAEIGPGGVPQGMGAGPQAPQGALPPMQLAGIFTKFGGQVTSGLRSPADNRRVGGVANSQHMRGTGIDVVFANPQARAQAVEFAKANGYEHVPEGDHDHFELPGQQTGPNPYASRPAEMQAGLTAGATEQAKIDTQVANAPRVAQAEADSLRVTETAKTDVERAAEARKNLPKVEASSQLISDTIALALKHPGRAQFTGLSSVNPLNKVPGTEARSYETIHNQLVGQAFLQAFEQLKGAGQITEVEGTKATQAMARLDAAQSDEEYKAALIELQGIANRAVRRARMAAGGQDGPAKPAPAASGGGTVWTRDASGKLVRGK